MKRFLITSITLLVLASVAHASKKPDYFQKGAFFSVDFSAGNTFNERINTSYGIDMAAGYRFCPQFVLAAGFGGHAYSNSTATCGGSVVRKVETTSVPVFIRLRSDILDKKVSPYVQLDLGYSFVFLYSRDAAFKIKYNDQVFIHRVKEMGRAGESAEIAKGLPDDWPFWCNPDYSQVAKEMKADPRWADWSVRTQR